MPKVQIDMFEVQLGASLLIQMADHQGNPVRIIADGGIDAHGYPRNHVAGKLIPAFTNFSSSTDPPRIDLMIGTHYDKDHIYGLVDVAKSNIQITQALLPPLNQPPVNSAQIIGVSKIDSASKSQEAIETLSRYLNSYKPERQNERTYEDEPDLFNEHILFRDDSRNRLMKFLELQWAICKGCESRIHQLSYDSRIEGDYPFSSEEDENRDEDKIRKGIFVLPFFEEQLIESESYLPPSLRGYHNEIICLLSDLCDSGMVDLISGTRFVSSALEPKLVRQAVFQLALVRKASAKNAITAIWLNKLVSELKTKPQTTPVKLSSYAITQGQPNFFVWNSKSRLFQHAASSIYKNANEPKFVLLGPSDHLVKRHQALLPIRAYILLAGNILRRPLTANNQLSYVLVVENEGQRILVTGDAGFVDFFDISTNSYYQQLLDALTGLNVIQVAHHAGRNSDFYHVLLSSTYPNESQECFLLLSHAYRDGGRPSKEFGQFISKLNTRPRPVKLLFTSEPDLSKILPYKALVHPLAPKYSSKNKVGDVRLVFSNGTWNVEKHGVQP